MLEIGSVIADKYKILNIIGRGGMSIVYLAMNERVNKQWAIKEIIKKDDYDFNLELQEIEMMKKLKHPHLPSIVDVIEKDDALLIVMDYIEGQSLEKVLEENGVPERKQVLDWGKQLCDVLAYLHEQQPPIIYRDMKPANVILKPDGTLILVDFGAAREYKQQNQKDTIMLGTRGYAAPEQYLANGQSDERTDIYCLGMMLLQLLTGIFPGESQFLKSCDQDSASGIEIVLEKCIRFRKEERYQSVLELAYALEHYWEWEKEYQEKQRRKLCVFLGMIFFSVSLMGTAFLFHRLEEKTRIHNYEAYLINAQSAGTLEEQIQNYKNAICLNPKLLKGYELLLQECLLADDYLTSEESEQLRAILNEYGNGKESNFLALKRNEEAYEKFAYEAGVAYFYKFEEESNKKYAKTYFEIAKDSEYLMTSQIERARRLFVISDYYYKIGVVDAAGDIYVSYKKYWEDMTAVTEGNLVELDNERTALVIYEELTSQLISKMTEFVQAGVSKQEIETQLDNMKMHLQRDFVNEKGKASELLRHIKRVKKMLMFYF